MQSIQIKLTEFSNLITRYTADFVRRLVATEFQARGFGSCRETDLDLHGKCLYALSGAH